jgi:cobalamin biosynthesis Mg chelatase CobN
MPKEDNKVFDVTKPGESKPDTGSKPMVVGHKLMKDPSITETEEKIESSDEKLVSTTIKKTITPLSESEKSAENVDDNNEKPVEEKVPGSENEETNISEKNTENTRENIQETENDPEKQKSKTLDEERVEQAAKNEENLQKIISEKKYFVSIEEASYSSIKSFVATFTIVSLIALVVLVVLIDLEILDLGITLPFDLI